MKHFAEKVLPSKRETEELFLACKCMYGKFLVLRNVAWHPRETSSRFKREGAVLIKRLVGQN